MFQDLLWKKSSTFYGPQRPSRVFQDGCLNSRPLHDNLWEPCLVEAEDEKNNWTGQIYSQEDYAVLVNVCKKKKFCITDLTVVYNSEFYPAYILFPSCTRETLFLSKKKACTFVIIIKKSSGAHCMYKKRWEHDRRTTHDKNKHSIKK